MTALENLLGGICRRTTREQKQVKKGIRGFLHVLVSVQSYRIPCHRNLKKNDEEDTHFVVRESQKLCWFFQTTRRISTR